MIVEFLSDNRIKYEFSTDPKPYDDLLPETQAYIDQLNERLKDAKTPEQRDDIKALISGASSFGDKEIVESDSDIRLRWQVQGTAMSLMFAHLEIHNEELAVPEHLKGQDPDAIYEERGRVKNWMV